MAGSYSTVKYATFEVNNYIIRSYRDVILVTNTATWRTNKAENLWHEHLTLFSLPSHIFMVAIQIHSHSFVYHLCMHRHHVILLYLHVQ